jgi:ankyrin repeat protein
MLGFESTISEAGINEAHGGADQIKVNNNNNNNTKNSEDNRADELDLSAVESNDQLARRSSTEPGLKSFEVELILLYILNLQDKAGNTPLHFACMLGQRQRHVAAALVRCGACLYVSNLQGLTALDVVESSVAVLLIRALKWRPNTAHCR